MIYAVTGPIDSGKTTWLISQYRKIGTGDGFAIRKVFRDRLHIGQSIERLSTGESIPFSYKDPHVPEGWNEKYRLHVYGFSEQGFDFAWEIARDIMRHRINPVFIDEIGPLELRGEGFSELFSQLLSASDELYFTVREACLGQVLEKYGLKQKEVSIVTI